MNCILIGYGEIGKSVKEFYGRYHDIDVFDNVNRKQKEYKGSYDLMLVAIPYSEDFVNIVKEYKHSFSVDNVLIFSTVQIGTTRQIENAVHSPVEGKHPNLSESLSKWQVFMGGYNTEAFKFFVSANKNVRALPKPEHTEFMKLQSTTNYLMQIEYARSIGYECEALDLDYNEIIAYNMSYNNLYKSMGNPTVQRPIVTPPNGAVGGHCLISNAKIMSKTRPNFVTKKALEEDKIWNK